MRDYKSIGVESHLANLPLFSGIAAGNIERISISSKLIHVQKGDTIVHAGDICTGLHCLVFGQIKLVCTSPLGTEKVIEIVRQGQSFGEALVFFNQKYSFFAQALEESMLIHISKSVILSELGLDNGLAQRMLVRLAERTYDLMTDIEAYSLKSARQRVIAYLLAEAAAAQICADTLVIRLNVDKGVIASRLNISSEHFSRVLRDLSDGGLLEVCGRKIRIPRISKLIEIQGSP